MTFLDINRFHFIFVGTFFGMKPCGIILFVYELFISESKSQVYGILHDVLSKWGLEEIGNRWLKLTGDFIPALNVASIADTLNIHYLTCYAT